MQFHRRSKAAVGINIAPLVDVVFLLVIFFAVSTTFLDNAGLQLELPASSSTASKEVEDPVVLLDEDGTVMYEDEVVTPDVLKERLRGRLADSERRFVILRADQSVPHGDVVRVMDLVREAGATGLTIGARTATE